jgi:hypothetical protein
MTFTPKVGDIWEYRLPLKPKRTKEVGRVHRKWIDKQDANGNWSGQRRIMYVGWRRLPKGRYSGIRVKVLMKYGKRISTRAIRNAEQDQRWQEMMARRPLKNQK